VKQHRLYAEGIRDQTGMLPSGAAEGVQRIASDIVAALHGDLLDRLRHVGDGDLDKAVRHLFGRAAVADRRRELREFGAYGLGIERLVLLGAEDCRKI
jgi:hypothetical protein